MGDSGRPSGEDGLMVKMIEGRPSETIRECLGRQWILDEDNSREKACERGSEGEGGC